MHCWEHPLYLLAFFICDEKVMSGKCGRKAFRAFAGFEFNEEPDVRI